MPSALVDVNTSGDSLLFDVGAKQVCLVKGINLSANGAVTVSLKLGSVVIWKTRAMEAAGVGGIVVPFDAARDLGANQNDGTPIVGGDLIINLSASVPVSGSIDFSVVGPTFPGQAG